MGIAVKQLDAARVVIELEDKKIIIENPEVLLLGTPQGDIYQVIPGEIKEENTVQLSAEDIKFVAEQTGVDEKTAEEYLKKHKGDIAKAIDDILASKKEKGAAEQ